MRIHTNLHAQILSAQIEAMKEENVKGENLRGMDKSFETRLDGTKYFKNRTWLPLFRKLRDLVMHESHKSKYSIHRGSDKMNDDLKQLYRWPNMKAKIATYVSSYHASIKVAPFEALYGRKCRSRVCWSEVGDSQLTGLKIVQETTEKIVQIRIGSTARCVIRFGKHGKLSPRYIGSFKILDKVGPVAYKLELPQELSGIHNIFHVSNLKKYLSDENLVIPLEEIQLDDKLHFIEEPIELMDRVVKHLKQSRIPIIKVRWNSKRGPEFT
ncbi:putative reverse transcriptase domain-containing protein [Tanacetum coccineum]